jgi:hypothetical protein
VSRPLCRHCHERGTNRPRGLCWRCYYLPGMRKLYPSQSRYANHNDDFNGGYALPPDPITDLPGTAATLAALAERVRLRVALRHPQDATLEGRVAPPEIQAGAGRNARTRKRKGV